MVFNPVSKFLRYCKLKNPEKSGKPRDLFLNVLMAWYHNVLIFRLRQRRWVSADAQQLTITLMMCGTCDDFGT